MHLLREVVPAAACHTAQHLHSMIRGSARKLCLNSCISISPPARQVLSKMLNSGSLGKIHGCISMGKEANVYRATSVCVLKHVSWGARCCSRC